MTVKAGSREIARILKYFLDIVLIPEVTIYAARAHKGNKSPNCLVKKARTAKKDPKNRSLFLSAFNPLTKKSRTNSSNVKKGISVRKVNAY